MISLETPQQKWASSRLKGRTSWIFSSCGRCSRLTTGTSGPRSGGLRKGQSPCSCTGASRDSSPVDAGPWDLVWSLCRILRIPLQCGHGSWVPLESPRGVIPLREWGYARGFFSRAVAAVSRFPSRGSWDLWHSLEAFSGDLLTRLSHRAVTHATVV